MDKAKTMGIVPEAAIRIEKYATGKTRMQMTGDHPVLADCVAYVMAQYVMALREQLGKDVELSLQDLVLLAKEKMVVIEREE